MEVAVEFVAAGSVSSHLTVVAVGSEVAVVAAHSSAPSVFAKKEQQ
jgi:hypothetical protein